LDIIDLATLNEVKPDGELVELRSESLSSPFATLSLFRFDDGSAVLLPITVVRGE